MHVVDRCPEKNMSSALDRPAAVPTSNAQISAPGTPFQPSVIVAWTDVRKSCIKIVFSWLVKGMLWYNARK